jgi:two-component system, NtrC family, sensor kinase
VTEAYEKHLEEHPGGVHIASACPAIVDYVRKYHPDLTDRLIPVVSPMIATALAVKATYGQRVRCVFIGPCVAKKTEMRDPEVVGAVDEVITFDETHDILATRGVDLATAPAADFDPPFARYGRVFPIPGGLLASAGKGADAIVDPEVIVVSGQDETLPTLAGLAKNKIADSLLVEALMCKGCYCGPGVQTAEPGILRKRKVATFAAESARRQADCLMPATDDGERQDGSGRRNDSGQQDGGRKLSLSRTYVPDDQRHDEPTEEEIRHILARTNKFFPEDELNCGACGYPTCRAKAVAVHAGMAEEAMCLPFIIDLAERVCHELNMPVKDLRDVHRHLINSEKLASMGQMAAGVAHELNNPLSTILLYSHILGRKLQDRDDLSHDLKLMRDESERCKKIIGNLLDFARQSRVRIQTVKVAELVDAAMDAAACNLAPAKSGGLKIASDVTPGLEAHLDLDQMTQVLVNLLKNGVEAMEGREGTIRVSAYEVPEHRRVHFSVSDQGGGIPATAQDKVFQPFFTTKSIGKGTGLGLPISYGIVKMHNGSIWFDTSPELGTTFHVEIPLTCDHSEGA